MHLEAIRAFISSTVKYSLVLSGILILSSELLLVQQSESPLALLDLIRDMRAEMGKAGFQSFKTLPFPQPCYPTGWWSVTVASKQAGFGFGFRQEDSVNKPFETLYYTAPLHTGVLVSPPFVAKALARKI